MLSSLFYCSFTLLLLLSFNLLSNIADSRFMGYLPSVVATATVMRVVNIVASRLGVEYQDQLLGILGIDKVVGVFLNQCAVLIKSWKMGLFKLFMAK